MTDDTFRREFRIFVAFAVQPFVAALTVYALAPAIIASGQSLYGGAPSDPADAAIALAAGAGLSAVFVVALAALPWLAWLLRRGFVTFGEVLLAGCVLGNLPTFLIALLLAAQRGTLNPDQLTFGWFGLVRVLIIGSVVGLVGASAFQLLAGNALRRRAI